MARPWCEASQGQVNFLQKRSLEIVANPARLTAYGVHGRTQLTLGAFQFEAPGKHNEWINQANAVDGGGGSGRR